MSSYKLEDMYVAFAQRQTMRPFRRLRGRMPSFQTPPFESPTPEPTHPGRPPKDSKIPRHWLATPMMKQGTGTPKMLVIGTLGAVFGLMMLRKSFKGG